MATLTPVRFMSTLRGIRPDDRDPGPEWTAEIEARPDGSPSLDALVDYPALAEAAERSGPGTIVTVVRAEWGGKLVAQHYYNLNPTANRLTRSQVKHALERVAAEAAAARAEADRVPA